MDNIIDNIVSRFLYDRKAANLSSGTIRWYKQRLDQFTHYTTQLNFDIISDITPQLIREYLVDLERAGHNPGGVHSHYRALGTFFRWYESEYEPPDWRNPLKVKVPKVPIMPLEPAPLHSIDKLLESCRTKRFTDVRDRVIFLLLIDTGVRADELLSINRCDICFARRSILIRLGKGRKSRSVSFGERTLFALLEYLSIKRKVHTGALFINDMGNRMVYDGLRQLVRRRSARMGVTAPTIHSFRRFFAITFLRNGGDIFTLQKLMGHADIQVLRRYLNQIDDDLEKGHRLYGPVDHLGI